MILKTVEGCLLVDYNKQFRLAIEIYTGTIYLQDLIFLKENQIKALNYNPHYNGIGIISHANFKLTYDEILSLKKHISKIENYTINRKAAFLTNSPSQVVTAFLYTKQRDSFPLSFNVFSTIDYCLNWVDIDPFNYKNVKNHIYNLEELCLHSYSLIEVY